MNRNSAESIPTADVNSESDLPSGISLVSVRVRNFRALREIEVDLSEMTVLIGANNSGKTSFLDAVCIGLGTNAARLGVDDFYIAPEEKELPPDRVITIDILMRPTNGGVQFLENFPQGSYWISSFGNGVQQHLEQYYDFVALRTLFYREGKETKRERAYLKEWLNLSDWSAAVTRDQQGKVEAGVSVRSQSLIPFAAQYVDARRDLTDDFKKAGSFWNRLTDGLSFDSEDAAELLAQLKTINDKIIESSDVLAHTRRDLGTLDTMINPGESRVNIDAIPARVRDVIRGLNLSVTTYGDQTFPLSCHGVGTRSLSSLLVYRALATWQKRLAKELDQGYHPVLALEEPEAHLHPQAQRALHKQLVPIPGQKIISTHSPYFASSTKLANLRAFQRSRTGVTVTSLMTSECDPEDLRKVERHLMLTRGELLFSRAVVFCEGETEEQALPMFAEKFWSRSVHELCLSFVGVGGYQSYRPFIWMASKLGLKWYVYSDGEPRTIETVSKLCDDLEVCPLSKARLVHFLPQGHDFEGALLDAGYQPEAEIALSKVPSFGTIEGYITSLHGQLGKKGVIRDYAGLEGRRRAVLDALRGDKASVAPLLAEEILKCAGSRQFPPTIKALLFEMDKDLVPRTI